MKRWYVLPFALPLFASVLLTTGCGKLWFSFTISGSLAPYGQATQIVFTQEPYNETASGSEIPIQVTVEDAQGRTVFGGPDSTAQISIALTSGIGPLNGTTTLSAVNGVANFVYKGMNIATLGSGDVITATKADETAQGGASTLTQASTAFTVTSNNSWFGATATAKWLTTGGQSAAGLGDGMMNYPDDTFVDSSGNLYVVDNGNARILKFNSSGVYQGWIGVVGATPTGGAAGCTTTTYRGMTPGWCKGGYGTTAYSGFLGVWGDGTYLYALAYPNGSGGASAIFRFNASTGAYMGWTGLFTGTTGELSNPYNGGCNTLASGSVTPGWCVGAETWGIGPGSTNGAFSNATGITGDGTYLYVVNSGDSNSNDIQRINASTGTAAGWIGNIGNAGGGTCGSAGSFTSGWCTDATATPQDSGTMDGSLNFWGVPGGIVYDSITASLYVTNSDSYTINKYTASTGAFAGWAGMVNTTPTGGDAGCTSTTTGNPTPGWCTGGSAQSTTSIDGLYYPQAISTDGSYLYILDKDNRVVRYLMNGTYDGWIGAIGNAGAGTCGSVGTYTFGWCTTASTQAESGTGDGMLYNASGLFADSSGNLWVADSSNNRVSKYTASSGAFDGWIGAESAATAGWQTAYSDTAGAGDDNSFATTIAGIYTDGTNLYISDANRIENFALSTLTFNGWAGEVLQTPTGGTSGCTSTAPGSLTPGWCTGGYAQIDTNIDADQYGDTSNWSSIYADGTYIYAPHWNTQVNRFNESTGAYDGWIGVVGTTPTGGASGCTSASIGSVTPGWCTGGASEASTGGGGFVAVAGVYSDGSYLYVVDYFRIEKFNASTGQFVGWIGHINTSPTGGASGCAGATGQTPGWCTGGSATGSIDGLGGMSDAYGVTGDGTYIYVVNNETVDRYNAATGAFAGWIGVASTPGGTCTGLTNQFNGGWCSGGTPTSSHYGGSPDGIGAVDGGSSIYTDGHYLYVANNQSAQNTSGGYISKYVLGTGAFVGWKGEISTTPTGGDPGCTTASVGTFTPGWCTGGVANSQGDDIVGAFINGPEEIYGAGDFIYAVDQGRYRIDRIGK